MKNTLQAGKFRVLIYKGDEGYIGICYETGTVDIWPTIEETKKHLLDGAIATLNAVKKGDLNEGALNQKPNLKYRIMFHLMPVLFALNNSLDVSLITKPIQPSFAGNF